MLVCSIQASRAASGWHHTAAPSGRSSQAGMVNEAWWDGALSHHPAGPAGIVGTVGSRTGHQRKVPYKEDSNRQNQCRTVWADSTASSRARRSASQPACKSATCPCSASSCSLHGGHSAGRSATCRQVSTRCGLQRCWPDGCSAAGRWLHASARHGQLNPVARPCSRAAGRRVMQNAP